MGFFNLAGDITAVTVESAPYTVIIWDPQYDKRVNPTNGELLCHRFVLAEFSEAAQGGHADLDLTVCPFQADIPSDEDKLIGCYIQVLIDEEVRFVGVITEKKEKSGTAGINYKAMDLWHAIYDKSAYVEFPYGISPGKTLDMVRGGVYQAWKKVNGKLTLQTTFFNPPLLPVNKSNEGIIRISEELIAAGGVSIPRQFEGVAIPPIIWSMAKEQRRDALYIQPDRLGEDELGEIIPLDYDADERTLIFGGGSDNDLDALAYIPQVDSITETTSYDGTVSQIVAVGGEITQSYLGELIPAWEQTLEAEILNNAKLILKDEKKYGAVGRLYFAGRNPGHGVTSFTDAPRNTNIAGAFSSVDAEKLQKSQGWTIWEYVGAEGGDRTNDDNWDEAQNDALVVRYNDDSFLAKLIPARLQQRRTWLTNNYNLVLFREPNLGRRRVLKDGETDKYKTQYYPKRNPDLFFEGNRVTGQVGYDTGHRGKYPRPRFRYIVDQSWTFHRKDFHTEDSVGRIRFRKETGGTESDVDLPPSSRALLDRRGPMVERAEAAANEHSRANTRGIIRISDDYPARPGFKITRLIDTDGQVIRDALQWRVKQIIYSEHPVTTELVYDNKAIF